MTDSLFRVERYMNVRERTFVIDGNGHDTDRLEMDIRDWGAEYLFRSFTDEQWEILEDAWKTNTRLKNPLLITTLSSYKGCTYCQAHTLSTDGFTINHTEPCLYPNGFIVKVSIDIPSGKMLIGNDFRPEFDVDEGVDNYVNEQWGVAGEVIGMAKNGCLHPFVGNSCPGVYSFGEDAFIIANPAYNEDMTVEEEDLLIEGAGERVASVCTDLWWASIVDAEEANKRNLKTNSHWDSIIEVTPGIYEMEFYGTKKNFHQDWDDYGEKIYAKITLVSEHTKENVIPA